MIEIFASCKISLLYFDKQENESVVLNDCLCDKLAYCSLKILHSGWDTQYIELKGPFSKKIKNSPNIFIVKGKLVVY